MRGRRGWEERARSVAPPPQRAWQGAGSRSWVWGGTLTHERQRNCKQGSEVHALKGTPCVSMRQPRAYGPAQGVTETAMWHRDLAGRPREGLGAP